MAVESLFDLKSLDLGLVADRAGIAEMNAHRGSFALIDEIVHLNDEMTRCVARMAVRKDAFWAPCHIPGRPIMPGVLLVEAGAQAASYMYYRKSQKKWFAGFTRIQEATFRGMVEPDCTLYLLVDEQKYNPKRFVTKLQGQVDGEIVFDAQITGMAFPHLGDVERKPLAEAQV
ncbi:MAG: 3-hydroxyacyl-ACP dehydratase FabZ family protein [Planctomycetota bacterium]